LAIEINEETGEEILGKIWDCRNDPEGVRYEKVDVEKIVRVREFQLKKHAERMKTLGYIIQAIEM